MSFTTFIEKSADNLGITIPKSNGSEVGYFEDEHQAFTELQKSSIWPIHHRILEMLEVVPLEGDYKAFAQVFASITWVYVAGYAVASALGTLPFEICEGKRDNPKIIDEGTLFDLFEYPNEWECGSELREDLALFCEITGNGYWEKWGSVDSLPVKLFNIEPYYMKIKPHPTKKIDYYLYDTNNPETTKKFYPQQITHFKYTNPNSIYYGQGSVQALQGALITEIYREQYNKSYFENEARPDVVLTHKPDYSKGVYPLQKEARRRLAQSWYKAFGGPRRARLPVLLESGMDIEVLSEARKDMDFREMEVSLRDRILASFGVPPALVGIFPPGAPSVNEQIRMFWRMTLPPKANRMTNVITNSIIRPHDKKFWCRLNMSDISALEETVKEREERLSRMLERGGLTLGQYRQEMGMRVEDNDPYKDKRVISANMVPLDEFFTEIPEEGEVEEEREITGPPQTAGPGFPGEEVWGEERGTHR